MPRQESDMVTFDANMIAVSAFVAALDRARVVRLIPLSLLPPYPTGGRRVLSGEE